MSCWVSEEDKKFLLKEQPGLTFEPNKNILCGTLNFKAKLSRQLIEDAYEINIDFNRCEPLPVVKEVGGRIKKLAEERNINIMSLHANYKTDPPELCLCSRIIAFDKAEELRNSETPATDFISQLIISFLYGLSYYNKFSKWPFGDLEHGVQGLIDEIISDSTQFVRHSKLYRNMHPDEFKEVLTELKKNFTIKNTMRRRIGRNDICSCGSNKKFKKCHLKLVEVIKFH